MSVDGKDEEDWTQPEWKILSLLLSYPDEDGYLEMLRDVGEWAEELGTANLLALVNRLLATEREELVAEYVQRFDFQSKTCLYLTAHELGDSRKRGLALVALRRMLADAGFYENSLALSPMQVESETLGQMDDTGQAELPDYIPLLFEFLAAKPADFDSVDIEIRLARVCRTIHDALPDQSVYQQVLAAALELLPERAVPTGGFMFANDHKTDLEELPYPLFYD